MRITQLRMAGFGPFAREQHIDFDAFASDGIFLIAGKTGAGKSSILDAICYALYDKVPRYDKTESAIRSDHCGPDDPTWVEIEFTAAGRDLRLRRSPPYEVPKKRGTGTTTTVAKAQLDERIDGNWQGVAAKAADVAPQVYAILGLSHDQFLRVILLAQNRFHHFLHANNNDRKMVLRTLFGTARFTAVEEKLTATAKQLAHDSEHSGATIDRYAQQVDELLAEHHTDGEHPWDHPRERASKDWFTAAHTELSGQLHRAEKTADEADAHHDAAEAALRAAEKQQAAWERRNAARTRLAELDAEQTQIDDSRRVLHNAARAESVAVHLNSRDRAAAELAAAVAAETWARHTLAEPEMTIAQAKDERDLRIRTLGVLDQAREEERALETVRVELRAAEDRLASVIEKVADERAASSSIPDLIDQARAAHTEAQQHASHEAAHAEVLRRAEEALTAAQEREQLDALLPTARETLEAADLAHRDAAAHHMALLDHRLAGHAAELASALVDGEPCAVCGSAEHPAPATSDSPPVTQEEIDRARQDIDECSQRAREARNAHDTVRARHAELRALSGGRTLAEIQSDRDRAAQARDVARQAAADTIRLAAEISALETQKTEAAARITELEGERERHTVECAEHRSRHRHLAERVAGHRGDDASVAARHARLTAERDALDAVITAHDTVEALRRQLAELDTTLSGQLRAHSFDTEADAVDARRDADRVEELQQRVRTHDEGRASTAGILADPELVDLPEDRVTADPAPLAAARDARDEAHATRSILRDRLTSLTRIVGSAQHEHDRAAGVRARLERVQHLANALRGETPNTMRMSLETYVLAAQLEAIVDAANARLTTMTSGRYSLQHDDALQFRGTQSGLGLTILDSHTGRPRPTRSLSGGETFLASLALALGLSEVVTAQSGGITLDTLFIDEGFGSLDAETLEVALSTLDSLRHGGRTIGLISHVTTMQEQIKAALQVSVTADGSSRVTQQVAP